MATYTHTGLGLTLVTKDDLVTRDVESWAREMRKGIEAAQSSPIGGVSRYEDAALTLRAAIKAGVVIEPKLSWGQVGDLASVHTRWYAQQLDGLYRELTEIPKA